MLLVCRPPPPPAPTTMFQTICGPCTLSPSPLPAQQPVNITVTCAFGTQAIDGGASDQPMSPFSYQYDG